MATDARSLQAVSNLLACCRQVMAGDPGRRAALSPMGDEFDELAHGFNRMLDWFDALLETTRDANNAIAHHMRTPLSALRLDMRALAAGHELPQYVRERIERQIEQVDAMLAMFDRVLLIAKAQSRERTELFESFDLRELVRDIAGLCEPVLAERGMRLDCRLPPDTVEFVGDRQLIAQALASLLDNACKYSHENDVIEVSLEVRTDCVMLVVSDRGPGIPPSMVEKVRQRFVRGPGEARGYGLGLSLASAVAALHGGTLALTDNGPGLKASLRLRSSDPA